MKRYLSLAWLLALPMLAMSQSAKEKISVTGGKEDLKNVIVTAPVPKGTTPGNSIAVTGMDGKAFKAEIVNPPLAEGGKEPRVAVLLPELKAGQKVELLASVGPKAETPGFKWTTGEKARPVLTFDGRNVLEFANDKHDKSTPLSHYMSFKPFHHVYAPDGKTLLTAGAHDKDEKVEKDGKKVVKYIYPHHRGLFFAFNKVSYDGKQADVWHGSKNEFASDEGTVTQDAGPLLGRHRVKIDWHGQDGAVFANEERELTVYDLPGGKLIDFVSVVKTDKPKVRLDGDPQHAGFHMRANQEVYQSTADQTYYLRQDGKGKDSKDTRNWDPKTKKGPVNLDWNAMSFVVGGKRYTAVYLDHPKNPKEARYSERDYGRFGSYFEYDLTPANPLTVRYRLWIQEGEMTVEQCNALSKAFQFDGQAKVE